MNPTRLQIFKPSLLRQIRCESTKTPSAAPKGTVLKGLNILQGGKDPIAMADEEYPDWLWKLTEPKDKEWKPEQKFSREYFKSENRKRILADNTKRGK